MPLISSTEVTDEPILPATLEGPAAAPYGRRRTYSDNTIALENLLYTLWRYKWVISGVVGAGLVATFLLINQLVPRYSTTAVLTLVTHQNDRDTTYLASIFGISSGQQFVDAQASVLRSPELISRVIKKLNLGDDPEFATWLRAEPKGIANLLQYIDISRWSIWSYLMKEAEQTETEDNEELQKENSLIYKFSSDLIIESNERSPLISITFESEDPRKAALITNTIATEYLSTQVESKYEAASRASAWLVQQVDNLREKVRISNEAVEQFRAANGLIESRGETVSAQQLGELSTQLISAELDRTSTEARLRALRELARTGQADSAPEVLASTLIQNLREQESELRRKEGELMATYGDRHPTLINLRAEAKDLNTKIQEEVARILSSLENQLAVAKEREAKLRASIANLESKVGEAGMADVKLRELQREADANQQLLSSFMSRLKETTAEVEIQQPDAQILSLARPPSVPSFPKKKGILAISGLGYFCLAFLGCLLKDRMQNGFTNGDQFEGFGFPLLGIVPRLPKRVLRREHPHEYLIRRPASAYSEACRSIWTSLNLQSSQQIRSILIASSVPKEGKSTLTLSLASAVARTGLSVVVVDADLRRPRIMDLAGPGPRSPQLDPVAADSVPLEELLIRNVKLGISILPAPRLQWDPLAILNSDHFQGLLDRLHAQFDLVVIDSAPVLAVADALVLTQSVDAVLMVVRWRRTPRKVVESAVTQLSRSGRGLSGAVLTQVNLRAYQGNDSGYLYGSESNYYVN